MMIHEHLISSYTGSVLTYVLEHCNVPFYLDGSWKALLALVIFIRRIGEGLICIGCREHSLATCFHIF